MPGLAFTEEGVTAQALAGVMLWCRASLLHLALVSCPLSCYWCGEASLEGWCLGRPIIPPPDAPLGALISSIEVLEAHHLAMQTGFTSL